MKNQIKQNKQKNKSLRMVNNLIDKRRPFKINFSSSIQSALEVKESKNLNML